MPDEPGDPVATPADRPPRPEALEVFGTVHAFHRGHLSGRDACILLGLRDTSRLLPLVGLAGLGYPALPPDEIERQAETFARVWRAADGE